MCKREVRFVDAIVVKTIKTQINKIFIAFVCREELMLHQVTDGVHFMQMIYGTGNTLFDCEYVKEPKTAKDFVREFWNEEQGKNHTVRSLTKEYASMVDFKHLKRACHKNHKKTRRRLANEYQLQQQHQESTTDVVANDGSVYLHYNL